MKKLILFMVVLAYTLGFSQAKNYVFNVELSDYSLAPQFDDFNGFLRYSGSDEGEKSFFDRYPITKFYQTYPSSKVQKTLNMFTFETYDKDLKKNLLEKFPTKYMRVEDLTGHNAQLLLYYPNDYGLTSPFSNVGVLNLSSYDYVNAPKAWDLFPHDSIGNTIIGISDGKVEITNAEFSGKATYVDGSLFTQNTWTCTGGTDPMHGTSIAAIAAAQGHNGYGMTGICPDCSILNVPYTLLYSGLLDLANAGAHVINMSWAFMYTDPDPRHIETGNFDYENGFVQSQQDVINELHDLDGVILVAGAGNINPIYSYDVYDSNGNVIQTIYPYNGWLYGYPASYNHVISVSGVNHKNQWGEEVVNLAGWGEVSRYVEDQISPSVVTNYQGNGPYPFTNASFTFNSQVDISAPGYQAPLYSAYLHNCGFSYGDGTSAAAPFVTGTAALMRSLNPCLINDEAEDIIQLTSKNLEHIAGNEFYVGKSGSGKLETGDAVEFTHDMMSATGNALVDGQDFWRFDFDLKHIFNGLTISNQIFRDHNTTNFTAKNFIDATENDDFKPDDGFVDLNIDSSLQVCVPASKPASALQRNEAPKKVIRRSVRLSPNPNKGIFAVMLENYDTTDMDIGIYDVMGKEIYRSQSDDNIVPVDVSSMPSGIYFVKMRSPSMNETIKFIKQ